jgi:hypothetical protein
MEKGSDALRERLLARLPQPENWETYREETAALMAKHERALFWEKVAAITVTWMGIAFFMFANSTWGRKVYTDGTVVLEVMAVLFFVGALEYLSYRIYRSKVDMLKEVKQVQLLVLELQASLQKDSSSQD